MEALEESKETPQCENGYNASSEDSDVLKENVTQRQKVYKHKTPLLSEGRPRSSSDDSMYNTGGIQLPPNPPVTKESPLDHPNFAAASFVKNVSGNEDTPIEMTPNADLLRQHETQKKTIEEQQRLIEELQDRVKDLQQRNKELTKKPKRSLIRLGRRNQQSTIKVPHPAPF